MIGQLPLARGRASVRQLLEAAVITHTSNDIQERVQQQIVSHLLLLHGPVNGLQELVVHEHAVVF